MKDKIEKILSDPEAGYWEEPHTGYDIPLNTDKAAAAIAEAVEAQLVESQTAFDAAEERANEWMEAYLELEQRIVQATELASEWFELYKAELPAYSQPAAKIVLRELGEILQTEQALAAVPKPRRKLWEGRVVFELDPDSGDLGGWLTEEADYAIYVVRGSGIEQEVLLGVPLTVTVTEAEEEG